MGYLEELGWPLPFRPACPLGGHSMAAPRAIPAGATEIAI